MKKSYQNNNNDESDNEDLSSKNPTHFKALFDRFLKLTQNNKSNDNFESLNESNLDDDNNDEDQSEDQLQNVEENFNTDKHNKTLLIKTLLSNSNADSISNKNKHTLPRSSNDHSNLDQNFSSNESEEEQLNNQNQNSILPINYCSHLEITSSSSSSSSSSSDSTTSSSSESSAISLEPIFYNAFRSKQKQKELNEKNNSVNVSEVLINTKNEFLYTDKNNSSYVLNGLNELRLSKKFCDIVLVVDHEEIYCHKCVLASLSSYFKAMFGSELEESKKSRITLNEIDSSVVKLIVEYAYTSSLLINDSNVQTLLSASNLFDIKPIKDICCRYMELKMDETNCIGVFCFADTHHCIQLKEAAFQFINKNFSKIIENEEFLLLSKEKLIDIIKNDDLNVSNEEIVYNSVLEWLKYSLDSRFNSFFEVLEYVRLPLISPYFLCDNVQTNNILNQCDKCKLLVKEAIDYNLLKDRRNQIQSKRTKTRKYFKQLESLIIICGENEEFVLRTVDAYLPNWDKWHLLKNFPHSLSKNGSVAADDNIFYVAGGQKSDSKLSQSFWQYNSVFDEWKELQKIQTFRSQFSLAIVNGLIYAVGGIDQYGSALASVECYDPNLNSWKYCAFMSQPVSNPAVCSLNGLLYTIEDQFASYYDPNLNIWKEISKPNKPRKGARACAVNGKVYLVGGICLDQVTNIVEYYDPNLDKWEICNPMIEARSQHGIAVLFNNIYVCGGETSNGEISNTLEAYDLEKNEWKLVSLMKKEKSWLTCVKLSLENPLSTNSSNNKREKIWFASLNQKLENQFSIDSN